MNPVRLAALAACVVLAGCQPPSAPVPSATSAAGPGCRLTFATSVPLHLSRSGRRLWIPITANGTALKMILDTGSEGILLTDSAAHRIGGPPGEGSLIETGDTRGGYAIGIGGSRLVGVLDIDRLQIGRMRGAMTANTSNMDLNEPGEPYDGLLGMSVLGNFDIDLDIGGGALRLYQTTGGRCTGPVVALAGPTYAAPMLSGYRQAVREMTSVQIGTATLRAQFDTGSPGTLIYGQAAAGLDPSEKGSSIAASGVGGKVQVVRYQLPLIRIGPISFRNVHVVANPQGSPDVDMLLGLDFMRRVHMWFSNSSRTIVMQYPPQPSPPLLGVQ